MGHFSCGQELTADFVALAWSMTLAVEPLPTSFYGRPEGPLPNDFYSFSML